MKLKDQLDQLPDSHKHLAKTINDNVTDLVNKKLAVEKAKTAELAVKYDKLLANSRQKTIDSVVKGLVGDNQEKAELLKQLTDTSKSEVQDETGIKNLFGETMKKYPNVFSSPTTNPATTQQSDASKIGNLVPTQTVSLMPDVTGQQVVSEHNIFSSNPTLQENVRKTTRDVDTQDIQQMEKINEPSI